jgi:hypothetical protein
LKSADSWRKTDTQTKQLLLLRQCLHGRGGQKEVGAMRASSIVGLLFAAVVLAAIPVSPQVTPRGVSLSVDKAQAVTYRRARVTARHVRRAVLRGAY